MFAAQIEHQLARRSQRRADLVIDLAPEPIQPDQAPTRPRSAVFSIDALVLAQRI